MLGKRDVLVAMCVAGLSVASGIARADDAQKAPGSGYVATPAGFVHQDCVFEVEDGATVVSEPDGSLRVEKNGRVITRRNKCAHKAQLSNVGDVTALSTDSQKGNSWVEASWVQAPQNNGKPWFNLAQGRFTVPEPPLRNGALLYFFNSLSAPGVNNGAIIQPVLQYGHSPANSLLDPGNYWAIASWYVTDNSMAHSPLHRVSPGDIVTGTMAASSCGSDGNCYWTVIAETDTQLTTLNTFAGSYAFNTAQPGVFEAYRLTTCDRTPRDGAIVFTDTYLYQPVASFDDHHEMALTVPWDSFLYPQALTLDCGYQVTNFERGTNLSY